MYMTIIHEKRSHAFVEEQGVVLGRVCQDKSDDEDDVIL